MDKNGNGKEWWKGSFPTWIVAIMIGIIGYFLQRELAANDRSRTEQGSTITELKVKVETLNVRILKLETATQENHYLLDDISRKVGVTNKGR